MTFVMPYANGSEAACKLGESGVSCRSRGTSDSQPGSGLQRLQTRQHRPALP